MAAERGEPSPIENFRRPEIPQQIGIGKIEVPSLTSDIAHLRETFDENGNEEIFAFQSNITEPNAQLEEELTKKINERGDWLHSLRDDIANHKKIATVVVGAGALSIIVATAGVELGIRHGRDISTIFKYLKHDKSPSDES